MSDEPRAAPVRNERPVPWDDRDGEVEPVPPPVPPFWGARQVDVPLKALLPYVNEDVLYKFQWGFLRKNLSLEEHQEQLRTVARPILVDLADRCAREAILEPRAVYGWFRCHRDGDSLQLEDGTRLAFPRGRRCIADYFGETDVVGLMAVTVGQRASEVAREWFAENRYTEYLYLHGFGVEVTEALAEFTHRQMRAELGIAGDDARDIKDLFHKRYRGCRYAYGYPACPDMADQRHLLRLLGAERIGIEMAEEDQLHPEQSTAALVVHHPGARYFRV